MLVCCGVVCAFERKSVCLASKCQSQQAILPGLAILQSSSARAWDIQLVTRKAKPSLGNFWGFDFCFCSGHHAKQTTNLTCGRSGSLHQPPCTSLKCSTSHHGRLSTTGLSDPRSLNWPNPRGTVSTEEEMRLPSTSLCHCPRSQPLLHCCPKPVAADLGTKDEEYVRVAV